MSNPRVWDVGSVALINGSTAVVGDDTGWTIAGVQYGQLVVGGVTGIIATVTDDTHLTLEQPWAGPTGTSAYVIVRENTDAANVVDLFDRITQALITLSLAGIHPDGLGTITQRNSYGATLTALDKKIWLRAESGQPFEYYVWNGPTSTSWLGPYPVAQTGAAGSDGVQSSDNSVHDIRSMTQAAYDAIGTPDPFTFYIITD